MQARSVHVLCRLQADLAGLPQHARCPRAWCPTDVELLQHVGLWCDCSALIFWDGTVQVCVCDIIQIASRSECVCGCVCEVTRSCWAASSDTRTTGQDQINHSRSQLQYHCSISPARPSRRTTCGPRRRCDPEAAQRFIEHLSLGVSEVPSLSLALYLQNSEPRVVPSSIVTLAHQNHARHHEKPRVVVVVCF